MRWGPDQGGCCSWDHHHQEAQRQPPSNLHAFRAGPRSRSPQWTTGNPERPALLLVVVRPRYPAGEPIKPPRRGHVVKGRVLLAALVSCDKNSYQRCRSDTLSANLALDCPIVGLAKKFAGLARNFVGPVRAYTVVTSLGPLGRAARCFKGKNPSREARARFLSLWRRQDHPTKSPPGLEWRRREPLLFLCPYLTATLTRVSGCRCPPGLSCFRLTCVWCGITARRSNPNT